MRKDETPPGWRLSRAPYDVTKYTIQPGSRQSTAAKEPSHEVREVFLTTNNMNPQKFIVCLFIGLISILSCVCYASVDPEDYFYDEEINRFEEMFKSDDIDLEYLSSDRCNVLHYAAMTGDLDRVKLLLEKGADVNLADKYDRTPLHFAASSDNLELVKYLVEQGADVNAKDNEESSVLHEAAFSRNLELVKYLVEQGADINAKDDEGSSILHRAAHSGSLELVQWLIQQGFDVNTKRNDGHSILHEAVFSRNLELVQWLVEQGADINAKTDIGISVLHVAAATCSLKMVQWLVEHGADVKAKDNYGRTVLHTAVYWMPYGSSKDLFEWLINQGVDVNAVTSNGETALSIACNGYDDLDFVRFLVERGADDNPNRNKTFIPFWFELWKLRTDVKNPFNDPVIRYLMLRDKMFTVGFPGLILALILGMWFVYRYIHSKLNRRTEK